MKSYCIVILAIRHYYMSFQSLKRSGKMIKKEFFWENKLFNYMILEVFICSIHNMPYVNFLFVYINEKRPIRYSINAFIVLFMMIRVFLVLRIVARFTKWRSD